MSVRTLFVLAGLIFSLLAMYAAGKTVEIMSPSGSKVNWRKTFICTIVGFLIGVAVSEYLWPREAPSKPKANEGDFVVYYYYEKDAITYVLVRPKAADEIRMSADGWRLKCYYFNESQIEDFRNDWRQEGVQELEWIHKPQEESQRVGNN